MCRLGALLLGLTVALILGSSVLFAAGIPRDDVLQVVAAAFLPAPVPEVPVETREPCDLEPPLPVQRALDRSALAVETSITPRQEIELLRGQLAAAERALRGEDRWQAWGLAEDMERRRALFPLRFGSQPREVPAFQALTEDATRLLAEIEKDAQLLGDTEQDSHAALFRVMLLDLAGRQADADSALAAVSVSHWCGNCGGFREGKVQERRSEAAERRGDTQAALAFLDLLRAAPFGLMDNPQAELDTRHGLLMLEADRDFQGVCLLQRVVDLFPDSLGAGIASAALLQVGALREPDEARIRRLYIDGREPADPLSTLAEAALARR